MSQTVAQQIPESQLLKETRPKFDQLPRPAQLQGLTKEFVDLFRPHTESDDMAMAFQFLVAFGNIMGRRRYVEVERTRHHGNLFVGVVGKTASARKGTSLKQVTYPMKGVDPTWPQMRDGLSTGEGMVHAVRDPFGRDDGVTDKRLCLCEPELASALAKASHPQSTLSPTLRKAWDGDTLSNTSKGQPETATDPHISLIAHTTEADLIYFISDREIKNGFVNRILWIKAARSKLLPCGGNLQDSDIGPLVEKLQAAIAALPETPTKIWFDAEAEKLWRYEYEHNLTVERLGLLGDATGRGAPQVLRLALIHAALDRSSVIRIEHLQAALSLWEYSVASAKMIFGEKTGNKIADKIWKALRDEVKGLTRSEITRDVLQRNGRADEVDEAFSLLVENDLAYSIKERTSGAPCERWFAGRDPRADAALN